MSQSLRFFDAFPVLFVFSIAAFVQPAQSQQPATAQSNDAISVSIGQSVVPLNGPWKFRVGDSPVDYPRRTGRFGLSRASTTQIGSGWI
jgi:hypothetical protein